MLGQRCTKGGIMLQLILLTTLTASLLHGQAKLSGGANIPSYAAGSLPGSANTGTIVIATSADGDCDTSGGSDTLICRWSGSAWVVVGGVGSGIVSLSTGTANPSASCTAPSASVLNLYVRTDTTPQTFWLCIATDTWREIFTGAPGEALVLEGTTTAMSGVSTPSSGVVTCRFDSTAETFQCKNDAGTVFTLVQTAGSRTANQFVVYVPPTGIPETAPIVQADLPVMTGDSGSGGAKGAVPAPAAGDAAANKVLGAGGTWVSQSGGGGVTTIDTAGRGFVCPLECNDVTDGEAWAQFTVGATFIQQMMLRDNLTLGRISFRVAVASGTSCTGGTCGLRISILSADKSTAVATAIATSGGSPDINSTGSKTVSLASPVALTPGVYWIAFATDSAALKVGHSVNWTGGSGWGALANSAGTVRFGFCNTPATGNGGSLTITPSNCSTINSQTDSYGSPFSVILER